MTTKIKVISFYFSLFILLLSWTSMPANAEDKKLEKNISNAWVFVPKAGQSADFEKAFKKHIAYRKSKDDPRTWSVYQADMGSNMNTYIVRSCCDSWSDLDDYRQWNTKSKASENWGENVSKHIAHFERNRSEGDLKNSNWPAGVKYKYVGVTSYKLKLGHFEALAKDKKIISDAAKKENWPYNWYWNDSVNGKLAMSLAIPYMNYGEMAPPEIKFSAMLAKHLGSKEKAKKVLKRWSSHFKSISYNVYVLREDLSM
ncbi:MAG: hypothetical protein JKY81_10820 [Colwellia sp.]|nr:hypothetical protein [Colwellia sp.]